MIKGAKQIKKEILYKIWTKDEYYITWYKNATI